MVTRGVKKLCLNQLENCGKQTETNNRDYSWSQGLLPKMMMMMMMMMTMMMQGEKYSNITASEGKKIIPTVRILALFFSCNYEYHYSLLFLCSIQSRIKNSFNYLDLAILLYT